MSRLRAQAMAQPRAAAAVRKQPPDHVDGDAAAAAAAWGRSRGAVGWKRACIEEAREDGPRAHAPLSELGPLHVARLLAGPGGNPGAVSYAAAGGAPPRPDALSPFASPWTAAARAAAPFSPLSFAPSAVALGLTMPR